MSRLGKSPIIVPKGVEVKMDKQVLHVKGSKGTLSLELPKGINIRIEDADLYVDRDESIKLPKPSHGLYRAMVNNLIVGTSQGFTKKLILIGVGYRATVQGSVLDLQLGYSHPTQIEIPANVQVSVEKSVTITITGIDKHSVGQFAAAVRAMRPPEPYKGKGIRYENEFVRKKAGKAAKGKAA